MYYRHGFNGWIYHISLRYNEGNPSFVLAISIINHSENGEKQNNKQTIINQRLLLSLLLVKSPFSDGFELGVQTSKHRNTVDIRGTVPSLARGTTTEDLPGSVPGFVWLQSSYHSRTSANGFAGWVKGPWFKLTQ